jgi:Uncharacterized protein conserved in bacteria
MFKSAIPLLHVSAASAAIGFYCGQLGFSLDFANRPGGVDDPCYMGMSRDGVQLHLSSFPGDGVPGGVVTIRVDDVDALHRELRSRGVPIDTGPVDQTWGTREMYVKDGDGNSIRFQS